MTSSAMLSTEYFPADGVSRGQLTLLHGWGFDRQCWQPLLPFLRRYFDVMVVDLPGFGQSPPLQCTAAPAWLSATLAALQGLVSAVDQRHFLVGWSLGGQLALRFAQLSTQVDAVLGLACNLQFCASPVWPTAMAADVYHAFVRDFDRDPTAVLKKFAALVASGEAQASDARRRVRDFVRAPNGEQLLDWQHSLRSLQLLDLTCSTFRQPARLLLGQGDQLVPVDLAGAVAERAVEIGSGLSVVVLPNAGHGVGITQPSVVAQHIVDFFHAD